MLKSLKKAGYGLIGILVIGCLVFVAFKILHKPPLVPADIKKQTDFVIFYPAASSGAKINKTSFKYDSSSKVLSYLATRGSVALTFGEQSTPQGFVDIPQAYDKLIEELNGYASFDSYYGHVDLTHPKEFNGQQSAAMNTKGTLMFIHATQGSLSEDQWKNLFNNLTVVQ